MSAIKSDETKNNTEKNNLNKYDALVYTSKYLTVGDQIEIDYNQFTGKVEIKEITESDKEILRLKSRVEHLQSVIAIYQDKLEEFISNFENDCMDGIAEMRAKREELKLFASRHLGI